MPQNDIDTPIIGGPRVLSTDAVPPAATTTVGNKIDWRAIRRVEEVSRGTMDIAEGLPSESNALLCPR